MDSLLLLQLLLLIILLRPHFSEGVSVPFALSAAAVRYGTGKRKYDGKK
jgi:hypothetical protein